MYFYHKNNKQHGRVHNPLLYSHFEYARSRQVNSRDYSRHIAGGNPPTEIWQHELSTWARNKGIEECQMSIGTSGKLFSI